jgi:hypothetical protein
MLLLSAATTDLEALAEQAGVDPVDLAGAVEATGLDPRDYLYMTGELQKPVQEPVYGVWDRLQSECETPGLGWHANTGNGYYGGLQFDRRTWLAYGGGRYAGSAHQATRGQQIEIAERLHAVRGFQPWPGCRRKLRLP